MKMFLWMLVLIPGLAFATKPMPPKQPQQEQSQHQKQSQEAHSNSDSISNADVANTLTVENAAAGGSADNEGNSLSVESNYESGPADLVLIPNNNTERCLRVFGFAFGNKDGSGMLGVPWRSKQCDYKGFASDADAQGNFDLGWFWRCQMKSAYKIFKGPGESSESAIEDCVTKNSGTNFLVDKVNAQKEELNQAKREHEAALVIIDERDREATRLKQEVAERRLMEAVSK